VLHVTQDERVLQTNYTTNPRSLLRHEYTAGMWTARKPLDAPSAVVEEEL